MTVPILLSASPEYLDHAESLADGIEAKLDWKHTESLSRDNTLTDECDVQDVHPESITSIHLPPGTSQPQGLSVAPGNVGDIIDFVHSAVGDRVHPTWLTVHTTRTFDYREHVERLATITQVGGYPLAIENTPDASCYHTPEDIAALAFLAKQVPRLDDVSILIDTAHVAMERRALTVDDRAFESVLERGDEQLRDQLSEVFQQFLRDNVEHSKNDPNLGVAPPTEESPWRPVFVTLAIVGGSQIQAIHLNDPTSDGLPETNHPADGLRWVLSYCNKHDIAVVLEPGGADRELIAETISELPIVG
ncbi:hypothetical protein [Haloarcula amylovorans]|uniref:hypothetical protein n=1 Tax=Haloarcula amylovorans TaxID=2562280 RepID=UPI0010767BA0|nr:hypothetical protein [Halomicroarcula amylolytica]